MKSGENTKQTENKLSFQVPRLLEGPEKLTKNIEKHYIHFLRRMQELSGKGACPFAQSPAIRETQTLKQRTAAHCHSEDIYRLGELLLCIFNPTDMGAKGKTDSTWVSQGTLTINSKRLTPHKSQWIITGEWRIDLERKRPEHTVNNKKEASREKTKGKT